MADDGYAFGDGDVAASRLALVALIFDPLTRAFLEQVAPRTAGTVLDLGCGPGNTTALLASVIEAERLLAVDASEDFTARVTSLVPSAEVVVHDVAQPPLPGAPADVIFARLLLAHLPSPADVARGWLTQLAPGGVMLLDEIDAIRSDVDVLADYEDVVVELIATRGALMYAGRELDGLVEDASVAGTLVADNRFDHPVDPGLAARMFGLNLTLWRHDPAVAHHQRSGRLDRIATGLAELAADPHGTITWSLRQVAVRES